ncbi:MAG: hypothetical protein R2695_07440 [Acidimicrobiales bacterium]
MAARRAELDEFDTYVEGRLAEMASTEEQLDRMRQQIEADRSQARELVDDSIRQVDAAERRLAEIESATPVLDLRDDQGGRELDDRRRELDEWEAELVTRAQDLDRRAGHLPTVTFDARHGARWGRHRATPV